MDELALQCKERMEKCLVNLKENFNTLRTGRANAALLDRIMCDYYGDKMPISQITSIQVADARTLVVKPYDKGDLKNVYAAIAGSDQNLNPTLDGDIVRIVLPAPTEEKRKELVKKGKGFTDEAKVAVRNIRREFMDNLKKDESYSDDLKKRIEQDIDKVTTEVTKLIDEAYSTKEKEIMSI